MSGADVLREPQAAELFEGAVEEAVAVHWHRYDAASVALLVVGGG